MKLNEHYNLMRKAMFELRDVTRKMQEAKQSENNLRNQLKQKESTNVYRLGLLEEIRVALTESSHNRTGHKKVIKQILKDIYKEDV